MRLRLHKLPPVHTYYFIVMLGSLSNGMTLAVLGLYRITVAELDALQLVFLGTVYWASLLVLEVPTGVVADVYSRRLAIILATCLSGTALLIEGNFPVFRLIVVGHIVGALAGALVSGAREAWISDELDGIGLGPTFLRGTQLAYIGQLVGLGIGVTLGSLSLSLPILATGGTYLACALFLVAFMPETGFAPPPLEERRSWTKLMATFAGGVQAVRLRPQLWSILAISLLYGLATEPIHRLWELHLVTDISFPSLWNLKAVVWIGAINVAASILGLAILELVRRHVEIDKRGKAARTLLFINAAVIGGFAAFALTGSFALAASAYVIAWGFWGVSDPVITAWTNQNTESGSRATVFSMVSQASSVGMISGGPILGFVAKSTSIRIGLLGAVSMLVLAQAVTGLASRNRAFPNSDDRVRPNDC